MCYQQLLDWNKVLQQSCGMKLNAWQEWIMHWSLFVSSPWPTFNFSSEGPLVRMTIGSQHSADWQKEACCEHHAYNTTESYCSGHVVCPFGYWGHNCNSTCCESPKRTNNWHHKQEGGIRNCSPCILDKFLNKLALHWKNSLCPGNHRSHAEEEREAVEYPEHSNTTVFLYCCKLWKCPWWCWLWQFKLVQIITKQN